MESALSKLNIRLQFDYVDHLIKILEEQGTYMLWDTFIELRHRIDFNLEEIQAIFQTLLDLTYFYPAYNLGPARFICTYFDIVKIEVREGNPMPKEANYSPKTFYIDGDQVLHIKRKGVDGHIYTVGYNCLCWITEEGDNKSYKALNEKIKNFKI